MIFLQEGQTVEFRSVFEPHLSIFDELFVFYLLFVLAFTLARTMGLLLSLRRLRKCKETKPPDAIQFEHQWSINHAHVTTMRRIGVLTLLLDLADLSKGVGEICRSVMDPKSPALALLLPEFGGQLATFTAGIFIIAFLYAIAVFFESRLTQIKLSFEYTRSGPQEKATN